MYNGNLNMKTSQYQAYAAATMTVGKTRQVVMLYDGIIRMVSQSIEAIKKGDFETRYNLLVRASEVVAGLQNSLDFENGGEISGLLFDYYSGIDARIFSVHRSNDIAVCEQVIKELKTMRNVWDEIDRGKNAEAAREAVAPHAGAMENYVPSAAVSA